MKTFYRILAPILSIAILPVLYFLPMIRAMVSSSILSTLMGSETETKTNLLSSIFHIGEYTSINDIVTMMQNKDSTTLTALKNVWDNLSDDVKQKLTGELSSIRFLIAALVFLALLVLLVLVFTVLSAVMKKHVVPLCLAGCAFVSAIAMNACFKAFAKPFISGAVNLSSIFNSDNATLSSLLGRAVTVDYLQLSIAYTVTLFILAMIIILTVCALAEENYSKNEK